MTATATRIPTISATSTPNFYDVLSSDGKTHYPMLVEGVGQITCGCWAGTTLYDKSGKVVRRATNCYHRRYALETIIYIDEAVTYRLAQLEQDIKEWNANQNWTEILREADDAADREAYETMMSDAA